MLIYIDYGYLIAFMFLFGSMYYIKRKSKQLNSKLIFDNLILSSLGFMILFIIYEGYSFYELAKKNVKEFNDEKIFYCTEKNSKYRISSKTGWKIDGDYFYRDSLMIRADRCSAN
jgi:uncharacterized membrane protein